MKVFGRNFFTSTKGEDQTSPEGSCCASTKKNTTTVLKKLGIPGGVAAGTATVLWALFAPCHPSATTLGIPAALIFTLFPSISTSSSCTISPNFSRAWVFTQNAPEASISVSKWHIKSRI